MPVHNLTSLQASQLVGLIGFDQLGTAYGILASTTSGVVTDESWKCTQMKEAGWTHCMFDDSHWPNAIITERKRDSKWGDFDGISPSAKWIWATGAGEFSKVYCRKSKICANCLPAELLDDVHLIHIMQMQVPLRFIWRDRILFRFRLPHSTILSVFLVRQCCVVDVYQVLQQHQ